MDKREPTPLAARNTGASERHFKDSRSSYPTSATEKGGEGRPRQRGRSKKINTKMKILGVFRWQNSLSKKCILYREFSSIYCDTNYFKGLVGGSVNALSIHHGNLLTGKQNVRYIQSAVNKREIEAVCHEHCTATVS